MRYALFLSLITIVFVGCAPALGSACTTECPTGYVCIDAGEEGDRRRICAQKCATGRDCPVGVNCDLGLSHYDQTAGFCNEFGSASEGAACGPFLQAVCAPGLTCGVDAVCRPACALNSSYLEDRRCPSGTQCALWYPGGYCAPPPCDVNAPRETQCQGATNGAGVPVERICRRWTNPGLGEGTTCADLEWSRRCDDGTLCAVGDAPPMSAEQLGITVPLD